MVPPLARAAAVSTGARYHSVTTSCVYVRSGTVNARASPKSASFSVPRFGSTSTFCGFRSLPTGHGSGWATRGVARRTQQEHGTAKQEQAARGGAPVKDAVRVAPAETVQHLVREGLPGREEGRKNISSEQANRGRCTGVLAKGGEGEGALMQFALSLYWHDFMYFFRS